VLLKPVKALISIDARTYANKPRTQVLGSKLKSTEVDYRIV
jgi:hypothetical protein